MGKSLRKSSIDKKIGGVCGGLGNYFSVDPTIVRIVYLVFLLTQFRLAALAYLVAWFVLEEE